MFSFPGFDDFLFPVSGIAGEDKSCADGQDDRCHHRKNEINAMRERQLLKNPVHDHPENRRNHTENGLDGHGEQGQRDARDLIPENEPVQYKGKQRKKDHDNRSASISDTHKKQADVGDAAQQYHE